MEIRSLSFLIFSFTIIIFAIFPSGKALKCYNCNSLSSNNCPSEQYERNCSDVSNCIKCHFKLSNGTEGNLHSCFPPETGLNAKASSIIESAECGACNTDLCNNGNAIHVNIMTAIGCFALVKAIQFYFA